MVDIILLSFILDKVHLYSWRIWYYEYVLRVSMNVGG